LSLITETHSRGLDAFRLVLRTDEKCIDAKDVDDECAHGHEREHQAEVVTTTVDEEASGSTMMMVTMRTFCRKILLSSIIGFRCLTLRPRRHDSGWTEQG
jgi:hypothetical protein